MKLEPLHVVKTDDFLCMQPILSKFIVLIRNGELQQLQHIAL